MKATWERGLTLNFWTNQSADTLLSRMTTNKFWQKKPLTFIRNCKILWKSIFPKSINSLFKNTNILSRLKYLPPSKVATTSSGSTHHIQYFKKQGHYYIAASCDKLRQIIYWQSLSMDRVFKSSNKTTFTKALLSTIWSTDPVSFTIQTAIYILDSGKTTSWMAVESTLRFRATCMREVLPITKKTDTE